MLGALKFPGASARTVHVNGYRSEAMILTDGRFPLDNVSDIAAWYTGRDK